MFNFLSCRWKQIWGKVVAAYRHCMTLPGSPSKIAQGVALGAALNMLPLPLVSIPISYLLARLLRLPATAAVLTVISLKWAVPLFFVADYAVGSFLLGAVSPPLLPADIGWFMHSLLTIKAAGTPFLVGAAVNAIAVWLFTYTCIRKLLTLEQQRLLAGPKSPPVSRAVEEGS